MNFFDQSLLLFFIINYLKNCSPLNFNYHSYDNYLALLKSYVAAYPNKAYLYTIGKSVEKNDLWVLAIADSNPNIHMPLRPEAKYVGNIHGNEASTKEQLLHFIEYLLTNQNNDSTVDFLLKNTRIHILVSLNPDGFQKAIVGDCASLMGRFNANGFDLNRNFPDLFECNALKMQPEVEAFINWMDANEFLISLGFHTGSMVVSYPYDNIPKSSNLSYSYTMDNDVFQTMALSYSLNHLTMKNAICNNESFINGITNGANWPPPFRGGMGDFNYWKYGCYEITVENSCCNNLPERELESYWIENRAALVEYLKNAHMGVRGVIRFANGQLAINVTVKIDSREPYFKTNKYGEYYRILLPGSYDLTLMLNCQAIYTTRITIPRANFSLLEFNIELSNDSYQLYLLSLRSLNRYGLFCSKEKQPASCFVDDLNNKGIIFINEQHKLLKFCLILFILFYLVL